jgi:sodium transport system ATP-binding protein
MIEADGLYKRFGDVKAISDVSFRAEDGRITGLLGPNGAGKSTTLRIFCGTLKADTGRAMIDGELVLPDDDSIRRRLGTLPHTAGLYPLLTARENIEYFGRLAGLTKEATQERALALIDLLELTDISERRAKGFSQGQRLKVALARALVHGPRNLILDEPTNGLDVPAVRRLRGLLVTLKEQGHCIVFSSHVMQEVAMLCDDIVVIAGGTVVAKGTPDAIREQAGETDLENAFVKLAHA